MAAYRPLQLGLTDDKASGSSTSKIFVDTSTVYPATAGKLQTPSAKP
jgi:hypothetical protein